jgi:hypothetical protein
MCASYLQPNFGASLHILKVEIGGDSQAAGLAYSDLLMVADIAKFVRY